MVTIGIIGAVLGLIQVMQHLDNIDEVGKGIAVAFVATIYGVASANIFFLPAAAAPEKEGSVFEMLFQVRDFASTAAAATTVLCFMFAFHACRWPFRR